MLLLWDHPGTVQYLVPTIYCAGTHPTVRDFMRLLPNCKIPYVGSRHRDICSSAYSDTWAGTVQALHLPRYCLQPSGISTYCTVYSSNDNHHECLTSIYRVPIGSGSGRSSLIWVSGDPMIPSVNRGVFRASVCPYAIPFPLTIYEISRTRLRSALSRFGPPS